MVASAAMTLLSSNVRFHFISVSFPYTISVSIIQLSTGFGLFYSITAITCIFFTVGHHHNHESLARRAAILLLVKTFTLDLLDTIDVLDVLFETAVKHEVSLTRSALILGRD